MIETPPPATATPRLPRMSRGQANLVRAFCLWTAWIWGTRLWNIWGDESRSTGFKAVHTVLAVVSIAFAVAVWFVVRRLRTPVTSGSVGSAGAVGSVGAEPAGDAG